MAEGEMSADEIGRMTLPQLACRAADKPPGSGPGKFTSFASYQAAVREAEEAWSKDP